MDVYDDFVITLEPEPTDGVRAAILSGLRAYNRQHVDAPQFTRLVLAARDANGEVIGGLAAETGWTWLHVSLLWVAEGHRRRGLGRRLLREAEREAARRGCGHADLDTFDFQALPFYEREGFIVFGVLEDCPPGHRRYFLRKALATPGASLA